jgi:hypothetical protein
LYGTWQAPGQFSSTLDQIATLVLQKSCTIEGSLKHSLVLQGLLEMQRMFFATNPQIFSGLQDDRKKIFWQH